MSGKHRSSLGRLLPLVTLGLLVMVLALYDLERKLRGMALESSGPLMNLNCS